MAFSKDDDCPDELGADFVHTVLGDGPDGELTAVINSAFSDDGSPEFREDLVKLALGECAIDPELDALLTKVDAAIDAGTRGLIRFCGRYFDLYAEETDGETLFRAEGMTAIHLDEIMQSASQNERRLILAIDAKVIAIPLSLLTDTAVENGRNLEATTADADGATWAIKLSGRHDTVHASIHVSKN
jgi:hypothetical protein